MQLFTPIEYLKIDLANTFGLDKIDWIDRLIWFELNKDRLDDLIVEAETPALYYASLQAYRKAMRGEINTYPISLDAVCSGMQILSVLTGDSQAAKLCNVVNTGRREDAYTAIYQKMMDVLGEEGTIERSDTKRAIMTSFYGSESVPAEVFGVGKTLRIFLDTMQKEAPAIWELTEILLDCWDPNVLEHTWVMADNFHVEIKVMGIHKEQVTFLDTVYDVPIKVNKPKRKGRSLGANLAHSVDGLIVREMTRRCNYDKKQVAMVQNLLEEEEHEQCNYTYESELLLALMDNYKSSGYLSSRVLECINKTNVKLLTADEKQAILELIDSLPEEPFEMLTIHDNFRVLPNYGNDVRYQYNLQLMLIAKSNMLSDILTQMLKSPEPITIDKYNPNMWEEVLEADYALS